MENSLTILYLLALTLPLFSTAATSAGDYEQPYQKRALCNTFSGCGRKRSFQTQPEQLTIKSDNSNRPITLLAQYLQQQQALTNDKDTSSRAPEALLDLLEYLKAESLVDNRPSKYSILVPKYIMDNVKNMPNIAELGNYIDTPKDTASFSKQQLSFV